MTLDDIESYWPEFGGYGRLPAGCVANVDFTPSGTYIEFRHAPNGQIDDTISGGFAYQSGLVLLTVVSERGKFTGASNILAQKTLDQFPQAAAASGDTGTVLINKPANAGTPFVDGVYWRQPIVVSYITEG